jgi:hypothetical protein
MGSETLRYRSKTVSNSTTGLLLQKFHLDTQRSHNLAQARRNPSVSLEVPSERNPDVVQTFINAAVSRRPSPLCTYPSHYERHLFRCVVPICSPGATRETTDPATSPIATTSSRIGSASWCVDHQDAVDSRVASIALLLVPLVLAVLAGLLPGEQSLPAGADLVHHMEALRPVHPLLDPGQLHYPRDS